MTVYSVSFVSTSPLSLPSQVTPAVAPLAGTLVGRAEDWTEPKQGTHTLSGRCQVDIYFLFPILSN